MRLKGGDVAIHLCTLNGGWPVTTIEEQQSITVQEVCLRGSAGIANTDRALDINVKRDEFGRFHLDIRDRALGPLGVSISYNGKALKP